MDKKRVKGCLQPPVASGTGLLALDVVFADDDLEPIGRWAGGTFGNMMTILSFLGWNTYPVSRLHDDEEATWILRDIERWGVDSSFISVEPSGTTPIIIEYLRQTANGGAHRFSLRCPVCRKHLPSYRPPTAKYAASVVNAIPRPTLFFFDRTSRAALDLACHCADHGGVVFFEPSGIGNPAHFREALALAHIVKFSSERIARGNVVGELREARLVIETHAQKGLRFARRSAATKRLSWKRRSAYTVKNVRDAAGCGDWFSAGLIHKLAQGGLASLDNVSDKEVDSALSAAQALGAWNCLYEGARGGMYEVTIDELWKTVDRICAGRMAEKAISSNVSRSRRTRGFSLHFCDGCP